VHYQPPMAVQYAIMLGFFLFPLLVFSVIVFGMISSVGNRGRYGGSSWNTGGGSSWGSSDGGGGGFSGGGGSFGGGGASGSW
jgi:uncharacterized protein